MYLLSSSSGLKWIQWLLYYVNILLDKLSRGNKTAFLLIDFNIELLNYHQYSPTNEFLDSVSSHMFLPHNVQPTRIRNNSKNLIDNIYSNVITPNSISGNLTATISDHLPNFSWHLIHHLQNENFLKEIGPSLIKKILF